MCTFDDLQGWMIRISFRMGTDELEERERERERKGRTRSTPEGRTRANPRAIPPQTKNSSFFITVSDLPCKRTCHGKGLMTKNIRNKDQNLTSLDYIKAFISDEI